MLHSECQSPDVPSLANIMSMATLTAHSAELTALLKDNPEKHPPQVEVGINIAFIALTTFSHCLGVKVNIFCPIMFRVLVNIVLAIWQD